MWSFLGKREDYVFLHIPKTAGTSVHEVFETLFKARRVSPQFGATRLTPEQVRKLAHYRMISGHISWADVEAHFPRRRVVTFLREPIDRCISWYYYAKERPLERVIPLAEITGANDPKEAISLAKQLEFEDFLASDHPHVLQNLQNRQTWQLGAHAAIELHGDDERGVLAAAEQHLQRIDYLGFFETFAEDLNAMVVRMQVGAMGAIPRANRTSARPGVADLPPAVRGRLQALNNLDLELYAFAKALPHAA